MTDDRPPVAAPALTEQDRATYRLLIRIKPDGPADAERIAFQLAAILKRCRVAP
jgi:hypothetical protein